MAEKKKEEEKEIITGTGFVTAATSLQRTETADVNKHGVDDEKFHFNRSIKRSIMCAALTELIGKDRVGQHSK